MSGETGVSRRGRTGRRPGGADTRAEVLAAARRRFAHDGYDGATVRGIAAEAGVDPALVHHYFGTKRELFVAAAAFPVDAARLRAAVMAEDTPTGRAEALARLFFRVWEDEATQWQLRSVLRSAMTHEDAAALLRTFVETELLGPVADALGVDEPALRVSLAAAQMVGLAMLRYVVQLEPLASAPTDDLVARVVPVLEHHLFDG